MADIALFLALVLIVSAAHKLIERERLAVAAARLTRASASMGAIVSIGAAVLEALAAIALLFPASRAIGGALAAGIWGAYGIALALRYGQSLDCGCSFGAREKPVDAFTVARAFGLSLLALACLPTAENTFTILSPFAALGVFALYLALGEIFAVTIPGRRQTS